MRREEVKQGLNNGPQSLWGSLVAKVQVEWNFKAFVLVSTAATGRAGRIRKQGTIDAMLWPLSQCDRLPSLSRKRLLGAVVRQRISLDSRCNENDLSRSKKKTWRGPRTFIVNVIFLREMTEEGSS